MITAGTLKAARDALNSEHPTYWFNELAIASDGMLTQPNHPVYYLLQLVTDPATTDFDGETYSRAVLTVQAWSTHRGDEWAALADAVAELATLGWERVNTRQVPGDQTRYGIATDFVLTT